MFEMQHGGTLNLKRGKIQERNDGRSDYGAIARHRSES